MRPQRPLDRREAISTSLKSTVSVARPALWRSWLRSVAGRFIGGPAGRRSMTCRHWMRMPPTSSASPLPAVRHTLRRDGPAATRGRGERPLEVGTAVGRGTHRTAGKQEQKDQGTSPLIDTNACFPVQLLPASGPNVRGPRDVRYRVNSRCLPVQPHNLRQKLHEAPDALPSAIQIPPQQDRSRQERRPRRRWRRRL